MILKLKEEVVKIKWLVSHKNNDPKQNRKQAAWNWVLHHCLGVEEEHARASVAIWPQVNEFSAEIVLALDLFWGGNRLAVHRFLLVNVRTAAHRKVLNLIFHNPIAIIFSEFIIWSRIVPYERSVTRHDALCVRLWLPQRWSQWVLAQRIGTIRWTYCVIVHLIESIFLNFY